jgi:hypothetical protein
MRQQRNALCSCGSGAKYKKCCRLKEIQKEIDDRRVAHELFLERLKAPERMSAPAAHALSMLSLVINECQVLRRVEVPLEDAEKTILAFKESGVEIKEVILHG